eukprot:3899085-Pyramimonas_sp.AAC.1
MLPASWMLLRGVTSGCYEDMLQGAPAGAVRHRGAGRARGAGPGGPEPDVLQLHPGLHVVQAGVGAAAAQRGRRLCHRRACRQHLPDPGPPEVSARKDTRNRCIDVEIYPLNLLI